MTNNTKIQLNEIAGYERLPFNLYDSKNTIIATEGSLLNSSLMSKLSCTDLYIIDTHNKDQNITSKISKETTDFILTLTDQMYKDSKEKKTTPLKYLLEARDKLNNEIFEQLKEMKHIGEFKIHGDYDLTHAVNVTCLSTIIALKLEWNKEDIKSLTLGCLLHDIGKSRIPSSILNKTGKLTPKEFEIAKLHTTLGFKIIKNEYNLSLPIALIALDHHEKLDGSGYPRGLNPYKISNYSKITTVADIYDAISSNKCYARAKTPKETVRELLKMSKQLDPKILYCLIHLV